MTSVPGGTRARDGAAGVEAVRTPQGEPRIVAVLSGRGGTGTTATAIGLGLALARNRADRTVLVDAHAGTASLGSVLAQRLAPTPAEIARDPWGAAALSTPDGLYIVDGLPWAAPLDPRDMQDALGVLTATYAFTIVDVGNDVSAPAQAALDLADQVVLVVRPGPTARADALAALDRLKAGDPARLATAVLAVLPARPPGPLARLVSAVLPGFRPALFPGFRSARFAGSRRGRPSGAGSSGVLSPGVLSARAVMVPYDRRLAGRTGIPAQRLRPATARAYLGLAVRLARPASRAAGATTPPL